MSLSPEELEKVIATRFGESKFGTAFTVGQLEHYVTRVKEASETREQFLADSKAKDLARQSKNKKLRSIESQMVCPNVECGNNREVSCFLILKKMSKVERVVVQCL
jgi:hypothetical protein